MNDEYSDAFKSIIPEAPSTDDWAAGARKRRRRSQAVTGSAVLALIMAVAIPIGLGFDGSDERMVATPSQTVEATPATLEPDACRDEDGHYPAVTDLPDNELPLGVERVWLCGGPSSGFTADTFVGAPEPLTLNADWAVAVFMEPSPTVGSIPCESNNTIGFTVVYEYPDGDSHAVQGSLGDCDAVVSGTSYRMGAGEYLEELRTLWTTQRDQEGTTFDAEVDVCPARTSVMGVGISDMNRAYACVPVGNDDPATDAVQIPLSEELVSDMVAEITSQDVMVGIEPGLAMTAPSLVFLSPHGDPFTIQGTPEGYTWYDPQPAGLNVWEPSPELAERITAEMDGTAVVEPTSSSTLSDHERACGQNGAGSLTPTDLPADTLRDSPDAVWLCDGDRPPSEPLVSEEARQRVVDTFRELPPSDGSAEQSRRDSAHVVADYADGQRFVVEVTTTEGFEVRWGADREHVRGGGADWLNEIRKLWIEQRNGTPQKPPIAPTDGICSDMRRSLGRAIDRYNVDGALCAVIQTESGSMPVEVESSNQLVDDVRREAERSSVPAEPGDREAFVDWRGEAVLLVDDYGDRLPLYRFPNESWMWEQGEALWKWKPSPELADELKETFGS